MLKNSQEKFQEYDTNKNGSIDRDELAGLIRALDLMKYVPTAEEMDEDDPPNYRVDIHTGGDPNAGCDASAYVTLFGERGEDLTGEQELVTKSFNRSQVNSFKFKGSEVGKVGNLKLGHKSDGTQTQWQVEKVVVTKQGEDPVIFGCNSWLTSNFGCAEIELTPGMQKLQQKDANTVMNPLANSSFTGEDPNDSPMNIEKPLDVDPCRLLVIEFADGLRNADTLFGGKSDPYAVVSWNGTHVGKTKIIDNTLHPQWHESFEFDVRTEGLLKIEVFDHDMFFKDESLGVVDIKLGGGSNPMAMLKQMECVNTIYTGLYKCDLSTH